MFVKVTKISQRMKKIIILRKNYYRSIKNASLSVVDAARLTGWAKPGEFGNSTSEFELSSHTYFMCLAHSYFASAYHVPAFSIPIF